MGCIVLSGCIHTCGCPNYCNYNAKNGSRNSSRLKNRRCELTLSHATGIASTIFFCGRHNRNQQRRKKRKLLTFQQRNFGLTNTFFSLTFICPPPTHPQPTTWFSIPPGPEADTPLTRHPPGPDTPLEQTPPGPDTPQEQTPPWSRHPPDQTPPGADTPWPDTPLEQTPPGPDTPRPDTPLEQTSPRPDTSLPQCMLGDTGNKRVVRILLECILVLGCDYSVISCWQTFLSFIICATYFSQVWRCYLTMWMNCILQFSIICSSKWPI